MLLYRSQRLSKYAASKGVCQLHSSARTSHHPSLFEAWKESYAAAYTGYDRHPDIILCLATGYGVSRSTVIHAPKKVASAVEEGSLVLGAAVEVKGGVQPSVVCQLLWLDIDNRPKLLPFISHDIDQAIPALPDFGVMSSSHGIRDLIVTSDRGLLSFIFLAPAGFSPAGLLKRFHQLFPTSPQVGSALAESDSMASIVFTNAREQASGEHGGVEEEKKGQAEPVSLQTYDSAAVGVAIQWRDTLTFSSVRSSMAQLARLLLPWTEAAPSMRGTGFVLTEDLETELFVPVEDSALASSSLDVASSSSSSRTQENILSTTELHSIPLFVLDVLLFPHVTVPLRIFEPRYRILIKECLEAGEGKGVFGIIHPAALDTRSGALRTHTIGCLARVEQVHHMSHDGTSTITVTGLERFRLAGATMETKWEDGSTDATGGAAAPKFGLRSAPVFALPETPPMTDVQAEAASVLQARLERLMPVLFSYSRELRSAREVSGGKDAGGEEAVIKGGVWSGEVEEEEAEKAEDLPATVFQLAYLLSVAEDKIPLEEKLSWQGEPSVLALLERFNQLVGGGIDEQVTTSK